MHASLCCMNFFHPLYLVFCEDYVHVPGFLTCTHFMLLFYACILFSCHVLCVGLIVNHVVPSRAQTTSLRHGPQYCIGPDLYTQVTLFWILAYSRALLGEHIMPPCVLESCPPISVCCICASYFVYILCLTSKREREREREREIASTCRLC